VACVAQLLALWLRQPCGLTKWIISPPIRLDPERCISFARGFKAATTAQHKAEFQNGQLPDLSFRAGADSHLLAGLFVRRIVGHGGASWAGLMPHVEESSQRLWNRYTVAYGSEQSGSHVTWHHQLPIQLTIRPWCAISAHLGAEQLLVLQPPTIASCFPDAEASEHFLPHDPRSLHTRFNPSTEFTCQMSCDQIMAQSTLPLVFVTPGSEQVARFYRRWSIRWFYLAFGPVKR